MKSLTALFLLSVFVLTASSLAAAPEVKPTQVTCKADLKVWSAQKTETLSIQEIDDRMTEMVACANLTKKHDKRMRAYLDEFYRVHGELATRAFDFIKSHDLQEQFGEEKNGTTPKKTAEDSNAGADAPSKI